MKRRASLSSFNQPLHTRQSYYFFLFVSVMVPLLIPAFNSLLEVRVILNRFNRALEMRNWQEVGGVWAVANEPT